MSAFRPHALAAEIPAPDSALEPFEGLSLEQIFVPRTLAQFAAAMDEIKASGMVGFDTESKPIFVRDSINEGPHIVQFATLTKAYIFQLHRLECHDLLVDLLQSQEVLKVGFGLASDRHQLHHKLGVQMGALLDLDAVFRKDGHKHNIGIRTAVEIVFKQKFHKSKKVTTSNWALPELNARQLIYAANDAYVALRVLKALNRPQAELPITGITPARTSHP